MLMTGKTIEMQLLHIAVRFNWLSNSCLYIVYFESLSKAGLARCEYYCCLSLLNHKQNR